MDSSAKLAVARSQSAPPRSTTANHRNITSDYELAVRLSITAQEPSSPVSLAQSIFSEPAGRVELPRPRKGSLPLPFAQKTIGTALVGPQGEALDEDVWSRQSLLSLDGGGVRGLSSLLILKHLMQYVAEEERRHGISSSSYSPREEHELWFEYTDRPRTGFLPCHYFDYICGTGTGGLIAIMLGRLQMPIDDAIKNYLAIENIFVESTHPKQSRTQRMRKEKNTGKLSSILNDMLSGWQNSGCSNQTLASDSRMCRTSVLTVETDRTRGIKRPYIFRSYEFSQAKPTQLCRNPHAPTEKTRIIDVCLATSAIPRHFKSVKLDGHGRIKYQDGSIWSENPSIEIYREIQAIHAQSNPKNPISNLVSIGSGSANLSKNPKIFLSRKTETAHTIWDDGVHRKLLEESHTNGFRYHRFEAPLTDIHSRGWRSESELVESLERAVEKYCINHEEDMASCATELVIRRQKRSKSSRWEEFVFGHTYKCKLCPQENPPKESKFGNMADLVSHLQRYHSCPPLNSIYRKSIIERTDIYNRVN